MFRKQFTKYFFLLQFILICYQFNPTNALHGPNIRIAHEDEFPFVVSISGLQNVSRSRINALHQCTGSLVTKQDVLTADHCLNRRLTHGFRVLVGNRDLIQTTDYFPMFIWTYTHWAMFIQRPDDGFPFHDIAFVKLTANVPDAIPFAPYGNMDNHLLYGLTVNAAGWGRLDNGSKPRMLYTVELKVLSRDECITRLSELERQNVTMDLIRLCTVGTPYAQTSHGDSGGPLLYFGVIVGVNHGVVPEMGGNVYPHQINLHMGIRYYQDFFEEIRIRFHVNFAT